MGGGLILRGGAGKERMKLYGSSFSELRWIPEWGFEKLGETILRASAYNSSRECSRCGGFNRDLTLIDRVLYCPHCRGLAHVVRDTTISIPHA